MPIYAYKCANCGHRFDVRQRYTDDPLTDCPNCEDGQVRRVISSVSVVFKGSGFYVTDNRNGKGKGPAKVNGGKTETTTKEEKAEGSADTISNASSEGKSQKTETAKSAE